MMEGYHHGEDDLSSESTGNPCVVAGRSSGDHVQKIVDVDMTTQNVNEEIKNLGRGIVVPFEVTTTFDEKRKFAERLKKYRMRIMQHRHTPRKHETIRATGIEGKVQNHRQEGKEISIDVYQKSKQQQYQQRDSERFVKMEKVPIVLKRSLPSSSGIDQMEADEQERQVRQKLAINIQEVQTLLNSYPAKPRKTEIAIRQDDFCVPRNSALYDFLTVSVCGSPVSQKPVSHCALQRSFSAPPDLLFQENATSTNNVESDEEDKIGDFVGSNGFWNDILLMESEIPMLKQVYE